MAKRSSYQESAWRRASRLMNTHGRDPAEAATYRNKAHQILQAANLDRLGNPRRKAPSTFAQATKGGGWSTALDE